MKKLTQSALLFGISLIISHATSSAQIKPEDVSIRKIWSNEYHNAFTSLIWFKGNFYCSFRQGSDHAGGVDGVVRIIKSKDGINWTSVAVLEKKGYDLRDPKLSVTPDGRILVNIGGSVYKDRKLMSCLSHVSFSNSSGKKFSDPQPINISANARTNFDWLWRVSWYNKTGYGVAYSAGEKKEEQEWSVCLLKTTDGINYDLVTRLSLDGRPNETTVRVMPDGEMMMMVRRESGAGFWGRSKPPYKEWSWTDTGIRFGGPDFTALNDELFIAGTRVYEKPAITGLFLVNREGQFRNLLRLPSGGDNSYPGFVVGKKKIFVSYYSSHEGNSSIYLAEIPLSLIEGL